jgi:hypothetical protein
MRREVARQASGALCPFGKGGIFRSTVRVDSADGWGLSGETTRRVNISSAPAVALLTSGDPGNSGGAEKGVSYTLFATILRHARAYVNLRAYAPRGKAFESVMSLRSEGETAPHTQVVSG